MSGRDVGNIEVPQLSLVVLIGVSGSGKSTFARRHFLRTEVLSSDFCRGLVSDDENDQGATRDAFEVLHFIAAKRLAAGRLTVVDATNVQQEARKPLVRLAREHDVLPVAIVLDLPERLCQERNANRPDRDFGPHVVRQQAGQLRRSLKSLKREGFRHVRVLRSPDDVARVGVVRQKLWNDRREDRGPFDFIGDVHGCADELIELLQRLGYEVSSTGTGFDVRPPQGRKAVFVGDLVDRGPRVVDALRIVMGMVGSGAALCVPGNHDAKLVRKLKGRDVRLTYGLAETVEQLATRPPEFRQQVLDFLDGLVSHYVLDGGEVVVAHAGLPEAYQGRASRRVREFAMYGETTGETDEFGLPVRFDWASGYRGSAKVIYGHTPVPNAEWVNRTLNIDTGCAFGGRLTAFRYPEGELVSVPARRTYYEPAKPFLPEDGAAPPTPDRPADVLDIGDVMGKRIISTRLGRTVTIREQNAATALEVMSRFAADPRWLVYLPPTMSPSETSGREDLLEHPAEAFAYYRQEGVASVVCEEKHMGSRAVVVLCRDEGVASRRFGISDGSAGLVYTRTGRRFFDDGGLETALLDRMREAFTAADLWDELQTDWACLDCELMPWSVKADGLVRHQYAAVGSAARHALGEAKRSLTRAARDGRDVTELVPDLEGRLANAERYGQVYRRYAWPVRGVEDLKVAPFHLLATEGAVHVERDHAWHLGTLGRMRKGGDGVLLETAHMSVDVTDPRAEERGIRWWEEITASGGEGMVVKPASFVASGRRGLTQPGIKCRGREYLRIIYGPDYTATANLERLRQRNLGRKRSLASREFALGIEALERFVRGEPLYRVHECVFGILALESEPVDPRL